MYRHMVCNLVIMLLGTMPAIMASPSLSLDVVGGQPIYQISQPKAAMWDSMTLSPLGPDSSGSTITGVWIGDADNDIDTIEVAVAVKNKTPRVLKLLTQTSGNTVRADSVTTLPVNRGIQCIHIGNCDSVPGNEIVFGTDNSSGYRSLVGYSKCNAGIWTTTFIDSSVLAGSNSAQKVWSIKVADVNADGISEVVYAACDTIKMLRYNAISGQFDKTVLRSGSGITGARTLGLDVGDFDPDHPGPEIVTATDYGLVEEIYWNGASWVIDTMCCQDTSYNFWQAVVGDFDPDHPGQEVAVSKWFLSNSGLPLEVYELYGSSGSGYTFMKIFTDPAPYAYEAQGLACGDVDHVHPGCELIYSNSSNQTYELFRTGAAWYCQLILTGGAETGNFWDVAVGDFSPYHDGNEVVVTNSSAAGSGLAARVYRVQDRPVTTDFEALSIAPNAFYTNTDLNVNVVAKLINNSNSTAKAYYRYKAIDPSATPVVDTQDSSAAALNPGEIYSFNYDFTPTATGRWTVAESLEVAGDTLPGNDRKRASVNAQDLVTMPVDEGLEGGAFPPSVNWDTVAVAVGGTTAPAWSRVTSGGSPSCTPHSGSAMAKFNSYNATRGTQARLVLFPAFVEEVGDTFSFWMYNHTSGNDSLYAEISNDRGATWTVIGAYPLKAGVAGWNKKSHNLDGYLGDTIVVALRGRSAYGYNIFVDDIFLAPPPATVDAGINAVTLPTTAIAPNVPFGVTVTIKNYGINVLNTTQVYYTLGGADTVRETWSGNLTTNQTAQYTFSQQLSIPDSGYHTVYAGTELAGDEVPENDLSSGTMRIYGIHGLPYVQDFNATFWLPADFDTLRYAGTAGIWTREMAGTYPTCTPYEGAAMAKFNSFDASAGNQLMLISPRLATPNAGIGLSFAFYGDAGYSSAPDSIIVDITTDDGMTWTRGVAGWWRYSATNGWRVVSTNLGNFGGDTIRVALRARSGFGNNMFLDQLSIYDVPPTITGVYPAYGATGVGLNDPVIIAFSEPMNTGSVNGYLDPSVDMTPSWNATFDTVTYTPNFPYLYNTFYTVVATSGTDIAGNSIATLPDTVVQFTTIFNQGPQIEMVLQPGDTYDGTGPFLVRAVVSDLVKAKKMTKVSKAARRSKMGVDFAELYYTTGTDWTTVTGSLGDADTFDFEIPGGFAAGQVVSYYIYAEDDQGDGNSSPANAPVGVYHFRILDPLPPSNLTANAGDMMVQLDWAPPAEVLSYYEGTSFWQVYGFAAGEIASTRFTPQHYPCKLEAAVSLWYNNAGVDSVIVHIWGDDGTGIPDEGNELTAPFKILPDTFPNYTTVDLDSLDIVINSGEFHIGYEFVTGDLPRVLCDQTDITVHRSLYKSGGNWYGEFPNDWVQAAGVTYSSYTKGGLALKSSHLRKGQKPNYLMGNGQKLKQTLLASKQAPEYPKLTGALAMAKNINGYDVLRGDVSGGPYLLIGGSSTPTYLDDTDQNGTPYYYVVRANYTSPDTFSANSNEATATPAALPILVVDDDRSNAGAQPDKQAFYTDALNSAGYAGQYTVYETTPGTGTDGPDPAWFDGRTHVIWYTGGNWQNLNTLTANDEANLATYLGNGGRLFLCGQDYLLDRYPGAGAFTAGQFPYDYLGLASASQDVISNPYNIAGVTGSLAEGLAYGVIEDPSVGTWADDLTKLSVAGTYDVLDVTAKVGEKTSVAYDNGTFRTVFFTTLFEDITEGVNTKAELMYRILSWLTTGVEGKPTTELAKPTVFSLAGNYPNPVRAQASIKFGLPKDCDVRVELYNIVGQRVKTLMNGKLEAGYHQVNWNGRNESGQKVAAGVYLVRMVTPDYQATRKMTVIR